MQYILTEIEYTDMQKQHHKDVKYQRDLNNLLCRVIANAPHTKIEWKKATGASCIRDGGEYCDGCPVVDHCAWKNKQWSK